MEPLKNKIKHKKLYHSKYKNNYRAILFPDDVLAALDLLRECLNRQFSKTENGQVRRIYDDWIKQNEITSFYEYAVVACFPDLYRKK